MPKASPILPAKRDKKLVAGQAYAKELRSSAVREDASHAPEEHSRKNGRKARTNPVQFVQKRLIALRLRGSTQFAASESLKFEEG